jgi:uncharacterized repeat protein (TIGR03837 family)
MSDDSLTIDILCKVVDNFGDAGVVYRLARALGEADPGLRLRLVVDNLAALHALEPAVDPEAAFQEVLGWSICRWEAPAACFEREPPRLVLECFACGRPDWFESLLFDERRAGRRLIVDLEYLSAEAWVEDFHLLPSLTRSPSVAKLLFMPGFTARTGGLILDRDFMEARARYASPARLAGRRSLLEGLGPATAGLPQKAEERFWVSVFSYERDYARVVADLAAYGRERPLLALVAAGKSSPCFFEAWESLGRPFPALALPFLPQTRWDEFLLASDFTIVRGEDTLSRAVLSGRPFLWQAYPQEGRHQLVKVRAFLERLRPWLAPPDFELIAAATLALNDRDADRPEVGGEEALLALLRASILPLPADDSGGMAAGFRAFAADLVDHGNLAQSLLALLRDFP